MPASPHGHFECIDLTLPVALVALQGAERAQLPSNGVGRVPLRWNSSRCDESRRVQRRAGNETRPNPNGVARTQGVSPSPALTRAELSQRDNFYPARWNSSRCDVPHLG